MKKTNSILRLFLAAAMVCLTTVAPAQVVPLTVEELYAVSDSVVHGKVVEQRTGAWKNKIYTVSTVAVGEEFRKDGDAPSSVDIVSVGGDLGPIGTIAVNQATLSENQEVVLFLDEPNNKKNKSELGDVEIDPESPFHQNHVIIGGFQGKFSLVEDESEEKQGLEVKMVQRPTPGRQFRNNKANPTSEVFLESLRQLKSRSENKAALTEKSYPTVGTVKSLDRQKDLAGLRVFDPIHIRTADMIKARQDAKAQADASGAQEDAVEQDAETN